MRKALFERSGERESEGRANLEGDPLGERRERQKDPHRHFFD